jgi:hypothetical protein
MRGSTLRRGFRFIRNPWLKIYCDQSP